MGSCMSKQDNNNNDTCDTYYNANRGDRTNDELTPEEIRNREAHQIIECMNRRGNAF